MRLILHIWRQKSPSAPGKMVRYDMNNADQEMSVLEMLDVLNEERRGPIIDNARDDGAPARGTSGGSDGLLV